MNSAKSVAIILAAGNSERYGANKLRETIQCEPVWLRSFKKFYNHPLIDATGIVTSKDMFDECRELAIGASFVVIGGNSRTESARIGFANIPTTAELVLFHDAARPYVSSALIDRIVNAIEQHGAAFPALPVADTIKKRLQNGYETLDRTSLMSVQTPQGALVKYFQQAFNSGVSVTDDMSLLEAIGINAFAVEGEEWNRKLTVRSDLRMSEQRTGIGYDVHRFSTDENRPLMLGGVLFSDDGPGLEGQSDADALIHSVVDALLGAVGKGDIGDRYPNTDPRWKDVSSLVFLTECAKELGEEGWSVVNIDVSVLAERPKIGPARDLIKQRIAGAIGIDPSQVGVKATTNEGLGSIGRGEGVASFAVATVVRRD